MKRGSAAIAIAGLLAVGGCGVPVEIPSSGEGGPFPHAEGYSRIHMDDAELDDTVCLSCHGEDDETQVVNSAALHCSLCHAYPPYHFSDDG